MCVFLLSGTPLSATHIKTNFELWFGLSNLVLQDVLVIIIYFLLRLFFLLVFSLLFSMPIYDVTNNDDVQQESTSPSIATLLILWALVRRRQTQTLKGKVKATLWAVLWRCCWCKSKMGWSETRRCVLIVTCNKPMTVPPAIPFKSQRI